MFISADLHHFRTSSSAFSSRREGKSRVLRPFPQLSGAGNFGVAHCKYTFTNRDNILHVIRFWLANHFESWVEKPTVKVKNQLNKYFFSKIL